MKKSSLLSTKVNELPYFCVFIVLYLCKIVGSHGQGLEFRGCDDLYSLVGTVRTKIPLKILFIKCIYE